MPKHSEAPSHLTYTSTSAVYTLDETISQNIPAVMGVVTEWSVEPELPTGLELDPDTGIISGTPEIMQTAADYTVTAGNKYGSTIAMLSITVNNERPSALSYASTACVYTKDEAITPNTPTVTGTVATWSVNPGLPNGLTLDASTGIISGTPTIEQPAKEYVITAGNQSGETTTAISITINLEAPGRLTYRNTTCVYTLDETIENNVPSVTGTVTSWAVNPGLPSGLVLDPSTGVISGIPDLEQPAEEYTITAENSGGSASATISITVNREAPSALSYETTSCVYTKDLVIDDNEPMVTGTVSSWSVTPELPHGLALNTATGVISGTPDMEQAAAEYTITAGNSGGETTATISITVNLVAPAGLSYETTSCVYTRDHVIDPNEPTVTGTVSSWSVTPALPSGLILGPDGVISGTPDTVQSAATYTITASNSAGSTTTEISITVNLAAPTGLSYSMPAAVYTRTLAITPNTPTVTGTVSSWSVDPALPGGLTLDTTTGVISGTPDTNQAAADYTITASNSAGSAITNISIVVNEDAPLSLFYDTPSASYSLGFVITPNTPTVTGTVSSWSVDPALPGGLTLNTTTGVISGTPDTVQAAADYTITATNYTGSATATISITVFLDPPTGLSYSTQTAVYTSGTAICINRPTVTGTVVSWSVDKALPNGLVLDAATGVISGIPDTIQAAETYTITATNYSGSATAALSIAVEAGKYPRFGYVVNYGEDTISSYIINPTTGQLCYNGYVSGRKPHGIAVDPTGRFVYAANPNDSSVSVYAINQSSGTLTAGLPVSAGTTTAYVVVDPSGRFVYAINNGGNSVSAYSIDQTSGSLTPVGTVATGSSPEAMTVDPTGRFVYVANYSGSSVSVYMIDQATGALTPGTAAGAGSYPTSVAVDPLGRFAYVSNRGYLTSSWGSTYWTGCSVQVYTVNQTTGALNSLGTVSAGTAPQAVTVDPSGRFVYAANNVSNNVSAFSINQTTGALTGVATIGAGTNPRGISIDPSGKFVYITNQGSNSVSVYTINQSTGALTAASTAYTHSTPIRFACSSGTAPVTHMPKFAYVANYESNTVSVYTIDPATGALTSGTSAPAGANPRSFAIDLTVRFAFTANFSANCVSAFMIDQASGALAAGVAVAAGTYPISVAVDPSSRFVYAANYGSNNISVYSIDQATGALTAGTSIDAGTSPDSITVDPSGRFAYAANYSRNTVSVYTINKSTGVLTAGTAVDSGSGPYAVTVDPFGRFVYVANYADNTVSVYTINQSTGALTAGTAVTAGENPRSVAVDPSARFAYTANYGSNSISVFTIDQSTGALTAGTPVAAGAHPACVTVDPSGLFVYAGNYISNTVSVYGIDQATGALTGVTTVPSGTGPRSIVTSGVLQ